MTAVGLNTGNTIVDKTCRAPRTAFMGLLFLGEYPIRVVFFFLETHRKVKTMTNCDEKLRRKLLKCGELI